MWRKIESYFLCIECEWNEPLYIRSDSRFSSTCRYNILSSMWDYCIHSALLYTGVPPIFEMSNNRTYRTIYAKISDNIGQFMPKYRTISDNLCQNIGQFMPKYRTIYLKISDNFDKNIGQYRTNLTKNLIKIAVKVISKSAAGEIFFM
jgi:hypothetical protein